jgi:hypothetical protein
MPNMRKFSTKKVSGTIYFNEDGSDIWIHYEIYEGYGTEYHIVNGEIVEETSFPEYTEETGTNNFNIDICS